MKWTGTDGTSLDSVKCDGRTLAKEQQRKNTRFSSVEKRINTSMACSSFLVHISCSQGHREHCHGMLPRLQQAHHHPPEGSPFEHHDSTSGPTSDYDDNEIEEFYDQLQNAIDQTPKKDILVVQGNWNAKVRKDACKIRIREDSDFWSLPP